MAPRPTLSPVFYVALFVLVCVRLADRFVDALPAAAEYVALGAGLVMGVAASPLVWYHIRRLLTSRREAT